MKKLICFALALMMALSLASCGGKKPAETTPEVSDNTTPETPETSTPPETDAPAKLPADVLDLLNTVWENYPEDSKFPVAGGDSENMSMSGPGIIDLEKSDANTLDWLFCFPADSIDKIDAAASLTHMMNANTFTCGAFHLKDADSAAALASALRDNMQARQWMCGFPDKLVVIQIGDYLVSMFGKDPINSFRDTLVSVYPSAAILQEEDIH